MGRCTPAGVHGRWLFATQIKKAYCPPEEVEGNPVLEYVRLVVMPWFGKLEVQHKEKGTLQFTTMEDLEASYK